MNPNNITSQYYDFVTFPLKTSEVTDEEISLVNKLVEPGSNVLDVGAGTGRHSLVLSNQGFNVTAIDSSSEMLKVLKQNDTQNKIEVIEKNIYKFVPNQKFQLITLFWNSYNEIALTKNTAEELLKRLKGFLTSNGKILINIDDSTTIDPSKFDFQTTKTSGEYTYKMDWKTYKYSTKTNTSVSKEDVEIFRNDKLIDKKTTYIKQRYWSIQEVTELANKLGLKVERINLKTSPELYLILSI